jgi:hypothetical protein
MSLIEEVRALETLGLEGLREEWKRQQFGTPPKFRSTELLRRWLAWKMQSRVYGGLSPETRAKLRRTTTLSATQKLKLGLRLAREWKGVRHDVEIVEAGVLYKDQVYASLSEVARLITGVRWNGPRFFGLRTDK